MSNFIDDINKYPLVPITTGDGVTYDVKMIFKGGSIDPLTASYNYPNKIGTKSKRNSTSSPVFDLDFTIDIQLLNNFILSISSFDSEWLVKHPFFGNLRGYPVGNMSFDASKPGDIPFKIQFQQNISDDTPLVKTDYKARVSELNITIQTDAIETVGELEFDSGEITTLSGMIDNLETLYENILTNEYTNKIYDIRQVINATTFDAYRFMELNNDLLNIASKLQIDALPTSVTNTFTSSVKARNSIIKAQGDYIYSLPEDTLNMIIFKENSLSCNLTALLLTIITPSESNIELSGFDVTDEVQQTSVQDYKYKRDVTDTITDTNSEYDKLIESVSEIDFTKDDFSKFVPNSDLTDNLTDSTFFAIQEVKEISEKSKEETIYITESDTTPELLAFKLYGSATDENINSIINDNDLMGRNSLDNSWRNMIVRKNVKIVYYA